jgi:hypothetical protein
MIESKYWKEDLISHAKRLNPVKKPRRWTEKAAVNFEKQLVISFLIVRKLFETHKVSSKSQEHQALIFAYSPKGNRITNINYMRIDKIYDLGHERTIAKSIRFIANQFIHSGALFAYRGKDRNWGGVYLCSDFQRNKAIYRIPVSVIQDIFVLVGNDYPSQIRYIFDENKGDYLIETD